MAKSVRLVAVVAAFGAPLDVAVAYSKLGWLARRMTICGEWVLSTVEVDAAEREAIGGHLAAMFERSVALFGDDATGAVAFRQGDETFRGELAAALEWIGLCGEAQRLLLAQANDPGELCRPTTGSESAAQAAWRAPATNKRSPWLRPVGFDSSGRLWVDVCKSHPRRPGGEQALGLVVLDRDGVAQDVSSIASPKSWCWRSRSAHSSYWTQAVLTGDGGHVAILIRPSAIRFVDALSLAVHDVELGRSVEEIIALQDSVVVKWRHQGRSGLTRLGISGEELGLDDRVSGLEIVDAYGDALVGLHPSRLIKVLPAGGETITVAWGRSVVGLVDEQVVSVASDGIAVSSSTGSRLVSPIPVLADTRDRVIQRVVNRGLSFRRRSADDPANSILSVDHYPSVRIESAAVAGGEIVAVGTDSRLHVWSCGELAHCGSVDVSLGICQRIGIAANPRERQVAAFAHALAPEGAYDPYLVLSCF